MLAHLSVSLYSSSVASYRFMLGVVDRFILRVLSSIWFSVVSSPPFVGAYSSFLSSSSLGSVSCIFFASGSSLGALVLGLSLRVFPRRVLFLLSLAASRWVGELPALSLPVSSLGVALFLSHFLVFGRSLNLPFVLSLPLFCCGLFGNMWSLFQLSSSCVLFGLFGCASLVLLLFLPVLVLSLSLHALLLAPFLRMPSVSSSVMSWLEHFLRLVVLFLMLLACPTLLSFLFHLLVLVLPLVRGFAASRFFSTVLLWLPSLWHLLDLLLLSFFLLPFRCPVLIVRCLWFGSPASGEVLYFGVYLQSFLGIYL